MERTWYGKKNQQLSMVRHYFRFLEGQVVVGAGYLTGSDEEGNGFSIEIEREDVFLAVESLLKAHAT